jgi:hypothetical protein
MQVVQTAGEPPNHGSKSFPIRSCTMKSKKAERNITAAESMDKA